MAAMVGERRERRIRDARRRLRWELVIVLGLAIAPSALHAVIALAEALAGPVPLGGTTQALNPATSAFPLFDVLNRLVAFAARLVPVALVVWLLWSARESGFARLGLDLRRPGRDLAIGLGLAAAIGLPGLALYAGSRALGLAPQVVAGDAGMTWWTAGLLVLAALRAALIEEVIVVGHLAIRLRALGWSWPGIVVASALVRGSYHLYQGVPMALGNVVMGLVFAGFYVWWSRRPGPSRGAGASADSGASTGSGASTRRRVMPLVVAHFALDLVAFLGYPLAAAWWPGLF